MASEQFVRPKYTSEGVRRLRTNPFLHFDEERVGVRAFFRSQKNGGIHPVEDWLIAEAEETVLQANEQLVALSDGDHATGPFDNHYSLVNAVRFPTHEPQSKRLIGTRDPRRCSLCDATPGTKKFKTEAHVLPESLGSRWLITYDECDDCNGRFGRELENELAAMLSPERVLARTPTKRGPSAKLKIWDQASSIGGQGRDEPLLLEIREGEESVKVDILGDHAMALNAKTVPFRPISAIKSLARTAWHLLPPDLQAEHESMRQWIKGQIDVLPTVYWRFFMPGLGMRHTTFAVWQRADCANALPPLVLALAFGNYAIVWAAPDWGIREHVPALLPLLPRPFAPKPKEIKGTRFKVIRDDKVRPKPFSVNFEFAEHSLAWSKDGIPVTMIAQIGESEARLDSVCSTPRSPEDAEQIGILYEIRGGQLIGAMHIERPPTPLPRVDFSGEVALTISYSFAPPADCDADATKTQAFLEALFGGASVRIVERGGNRMVAQVPSGAAARPPAGILERALQVCVAIGQINVEFKMCITMPHKGDPESERNALLLATAMANQGTVGERAPGGIVTLQISQGSVQDALTALTTGPHLALSREETYLIYGVAVEPGAELFVLENAALTCTPEEVRRAAEEAGPDGWVTVEIRCTRVIRRFQRWTTTSA